MAALVKPVSNSASTATSQRARMVQVRVPETRVHMDFVLLKWRAHLANYSTAKVVRVPPSIHRTEAGTPRARAPKACNECHAHKTRCTSEHPQCRRCKSMNIECVYEKIQRKSAAASGSRPSAMPNRVVASSQSLVTSSEQPLKAQQSIESSHLASPSASLSSHTHTNRHLSLGHNLLVECVPRLKSDTPLHLLRLRVASRTCF